jgi:hypothetical protein
MNRSRPFDALIVAVLFLGGLAEPLFALTTTFPSGSGSTVTDTVGGVTVTFSTTGDFSQWDQQTSAIDPSLRNIGFANYQLSFSTPIHSLSFDIGGLDTAWGDVIYSFLADNNPIGLATGPPTNISQGFNLHTAVWNGSQLLPGSEQDNGARVFFGSTVISTLKFSSSGTSSASNHWILYDNFSFVAVPEPATCSIALTACGVVAALLRRR